MKYDYTRTVGLGALALALSTAGCGGGTPTSVTPPANPSLVGAQSASGFALPDRRHHHHGFCAVVTNSQNFNGTAIARGSWIWFSSVTSFPGNNGDVRAEMRDSKITFSDGTKRIKIGGPSMRISLAGSTVKLRFKSLGLFSRKGMWRLSAPVNTAGNDLLDTVAYRATRGLSGGIQNVTWSAKFYSKSAVKSMHWQWGAAVYTRFSKSYKRLGVKPLDDNHYPPYNSDPAGTPERYKQFVTGGATGGGGSNYTGGLSGTVNITPCK